MPFTVLPECQISIHQRGFYRGKLCRAKILFSEEPVNRTAGDLSQKHPFRIDPTVALRGASTNEYRTRRTQRDQLVRIHRQVFIVERTVVLQKISGEPMILARPCEIPDLFSEMPPVQLRPALARGTDVRNGKARIVCHRNQRCLSVTRMTLDANPFRIDRPFGERRAL